MKKGKVSLSLYYLCLTMTMAIMFNLFPIYLANNLGFNAREVGIIMSTTGLVAIFTTLFWGNVYDKLKSAPRLILFLSISYLILNFFVFKSNVFIYILLVRIIADFFRSGLFPTTDNYLFNFAHKYDISASSIRLFGSLGYSLIILVISFLLDSNNIQIALYFTCVLMLLGSSMTLFMPKINHGDCNYSSSMFTSISLLIKNKYFVLPMLFFSLLLGTSEAFFTFNGQHLLITLNATSIGLGLSILFASGVEIPIFCIVNRIHKRISIYDVFIFVAILNLIRWLLLFFVTNPYVYIILMSIHGISFALTFQGVIHLIKKSTNHSIHGVALALLGTVQGLSNFLVTITSGFLIDYFNSTFSVFVFYFLIGIIILLIAFNIKQNKK